MTTPDGHEEPGLFAAVVQRHAYGRDVSFRLPEDADPVLQRDRALAAVEGTADGQDRAVIDQGLRALCERGRTFSINDLRPLLPILDRVNYSGWLMAELDQSKRTGRESAALAKQYLTETLGFKLGDR